MENLPDDDIPVDLQACHVCGRTFVSASLQKHEKVCEKNLVKRRKPFDSLKQRVEGTDIAQFHQKTYLKKPEPVQEIRKTKKNTWKEKHLELLSSIRAAKGIPSETETSGPPMKSSSSFQADTERCPSCDRQFGPKAYDRHVEWCKEKKANQRIVNSPANVLLAKERLEARTKYVPPLNKAKKTPVREKYSNQSPSPGKTGSTVSLVSQPSIRRKAKVDSNFAKTREKTVIEDRRDVPRKKLEKRFEGRKDEQGGRSFQPANCALPMITKCDSVQSSKNCTEDPFTIAQQQLMELLDCTNFKSLAYTPTKHDQQQHQQPAKQTTHKAPAKKNSSINHRTPTDSLDSLSDDFELMESLIDENFRESNTSSTNSKTIVDDELPDIDPYLINENDNLSLPENFIIDEDSPTSSIGNRFVVEKSVNNKQQKSNIDKRVFSGNSVTKTPIPAKKVSTAPSSAKPTNGLVRKNSQRLTNKSVYSYSTEKLTKTERRDSSVTSKKSTSPDLSTSIKNRKNTRGAEVDVKQRSKGDWIDINNDLKSSDLTLKPEDLFAVDDAMYEEFKKYEEMYLQGKKEKNSSKKQKPKLIEINYKILTSEENKVANRNSNKISTDSAYGSLTRSTPENRHVIPNNFLLEETIMDGVQLDEKDRSVSPKCQDNRLPKFCHECGNKYPLTTAKFCVECGVRRLIL